MNLNKYLPLTETTFYIILALTEPSHGYATMQKVEELSNGKVRIAAGTMYCALENLTNQNFIKDSPQQLHYKVDYRTFKNKKDFERYALLFEDAGFKHIWGDRYTGRQYFLPDNKEACIEIFSDIQSKAQLYIRLQKNCVFSFIMMLAYMMINSISVDFVLSGCSSKMQNVSIDKYLKE